MATATLTVGTGTQQWTPPSDCLVIDLVELWGPGGSGGKRAGRVTGGGSGAYVAIPGPIRVADLLTAGTVPYQTGRGGAAQSTTSTNGNPGTAATWFFSSTFFSADLGGAGQQANSGTVAGGIAGAVASCIPAWAGKVGGAGGTCSSASGASGGGASGSAAGNGVDAAAISTGVAGAGATAPAGGGSGGAATISTTTATSGSSPGGGGGGHNNTTGNSGAGADGQIVITYTPNKSYLTAWGPSRASPLLIFSNNDLTVTQSSAAIAAARTTIGGSGKTSGKYYWELTISGNMGNASPGICDGNDTASNYMGFSAGSIGWYESGTVYYNSVTTGFAWAPLSSAGPNRVCFALDLDNHKLWGRLANGNWNNDVLANQNPATNTGGLDLTVLGAGAVYANGCRPAVNLENSASGDTATGAFAPSDWTYAPPDGFQSVDMSRRPFQQQAQMLPILAQ